jgi:crotonobetainyl-CoA:carnitine CoA-transferase CaiB-like acyl-CoA transferase
VTFRPLAGVRVVDVTTSLAGPTCTTILGALGADVIKVEPIAGDEARHWGPPFEDGQGVLFLTANASKRSLAVSLRDEGAREAVRLLSDRADVVVQSLRPGLAGELGLDAASLRARNPKLVCLTISAFGVRGPLAGRPGYDPLIQAASGIVSVTGEPGRPGVRAGVSLVDQTTGVWGALGILAALHGGGGRELELSLYETALDLMAYHLRAFAVDGEVPGRHGTAFPLIAPYEVFPTADGDLMIAAANDGLWRRLCECIGLPDEERFRTNPDRVRQRVALAAAITERLAADTAVAWSERLAVAGVPAAPVADVAQVAAAEQTSAVALLAGLGGLPLAVDGERVTHTSPPPAPGADTRAILAELGYATAEIEDMAARGAVRIDPGVGPVAGPAPRSRPA